MKTQDEIAQKIKSRAGQFLDFLPEVLIEYLSFDKARPFLNEDVIAEKGEEEARKEWGGCKDVTEELVIAEMKDYMEFAWGKAIDERGISATRSIQKMEAWMFLLGKDEGFDFESDYEPYGKPILRKICELFDFPIPEGE